MGWRQIGVRKIAEGMFSRVFGEVSVVIVMRG